MVFLKLRELFRSCIKAVNLGEDTDTTGAITGGLPEFITDLKIFLRNGLVNWPEKMILRSCGKLNHKYGVIK
jgi:ADP-ribosylglycohydrolase